MIDRALQQQYLHAQEEGWVAFFKGAGLACDFEPALLMAIASRETGMRNILGDGGHGHGLMQIDDRSFPDWCAMGFWREADKAIAKGAQALAEKRAAVQEAQGKRIVIGRKRFIGRAGLSEGDLSRIAVAAYNCGLWAYYGFTLYNDPDRLTTGHDYSRDVLRRAGVFAHLLARAG